MVESKSLQSRRRKMTRRMWLVVLVVALEVVTGFGLLVLADAVGPPLPPEPPVPPLPPEPPVPPLPPEPPVPPLPPEPPPVPLDEIVLTREARLVFWDILDGTLFIGIRNTGDESLRVVVEGFFGVVPYENWGYPDSDTIFSRQEVVHNDDPTTSQDESVLGPGQEVVIKFSLPRDATMPAGSYSWLSLMSDGSTAVDIVRVDYANFYCMPFDLDIRVAFEMKIDDVPVRGLVYVHPWW
jgi:hypothetical protein